MEMNGTKEGDERQRRLPTTRASRVKLGVPGGDLKTGESAKVVGDQVGATTTSEEGEAMSGDRKNKKSGCRSGKEPT